MSKTRLNAIPRASGQQPAPSLDEWVDGEDQPRAAPSKTVTIKAKVSPELRRQLRVLAAEQDTTVADILRELVQGYVDERSSGRRAGSSLQ